jgi:hypothetical protein
MFYEHTFAKQTTKTGYETAIECMGAERCFPGEQPQIFLKDKEEFHEDF